MGRKERRQIARETAKASRNIQQMQADEQRVAFFRNGITDKDLQKARDTAYSEGLEKGRSQGYDMAFAAMLLALNECFGFGHERCVRVMEKAWYHTEFTLDSHELIQEVYDRTGLELQMDDVEPVVRKEPKRRKKGGRKHEG